MMESQSRSTRKINELVMTQKYVFLFDDRVGPRKRRQKKICRAKRSRENSVQNFLIKSFKLGHGRLAKRAWRKNLLIQSKDPPQAQTPFREINFASSNETDAFMAATSFVFFFPSQEFPTSSKTFNSWKKTKTVVKLEVCASGS